MSIQQGIALGLDISRGARHESRISAEHDQNMQDRKANAEYVARMRPIQEQSAQLGLADLQGQVEYNKEYRPMALAETQAQNEHNAQLRPLTLAEAQAQNEHNAKLRPLDLQSANLSLDAGKHNLAQSQKAAGWQDQDRAKAQVSAEKAERLRRVQEMTPVEWARFERTGKFSEAYLRDSMDTPVSPFYAADPEIADALQQAKAYLDPKNEQANPYADGRIFQIASTLMKKDLNNGGTNPETGLPIVDKQIVSAVQARTPDGKPLKGQLFVELEMTDSEGNTYRNGLTTNRSSDDDDPLKTVDFGKFVGRINAQEMFSQSMRANPKGMEWVKAKQKEFTGGSKGSKLNSDEIQWQNRPQKAAQIYKQFTDDRTYGNAAEGVQYVSYGDYEWTGGEPSKVKFLESVARENKEVEDKYQKMLGDDPQKAAEYKQTNYVHEPAELWSMQEQAKQNKAQGNSKADGVVSRIGGENKTPAPSQPAEPDPIDTLTSQPNWWLTNEPIPTAAAEKLTKEQTRARYEHLRKSRTDQAAEKDIAAGMARDFIRRGDYQKLSGPERTQWFAQNARYLSTEERKQLNKGSN